MKITNEPDDEMIRTIDGEDHINAAAFLMIAADVTYDPHENLASVARAMAAIDALLSASSRHGFAQADVLRTMFATGDRSPRMVALAKEALRGVPTDEILTALASVGFGGR